MVNIINRLKVRFEHVEVIQLRNVTDAVHPRLKARAAIAGTSLSDYLLAEIKGIGKGPRSQNHGSGYTSVSRFQLRSIPLTLVREERKTR